MLDSNSIKRLFADALDKEIVRYGISSQDVRRAVRNLADVYAPRPNSLKSSSVDFANFNDAAHRCAFLHKCAAFHTAMVQDMVFRIVYELPFLFKPIIASEDFKLCSLGGGPGSDAIGVIAALTAHFSIFKCNVTIIDIMEQWEVTFSSLIEELDKGNYGTLRTSVCDIFLKWNYIGANLLGVMTPPVHRAITQASLITMVKFVSAAACQDSEEMIKKIFRTMKPGALLLFIDNDAGGFIGLIEDAARECRFEKMFGPVNHYKYLNHTLKIDRFGYTSCFTTTVTVLVLRKPLQQHSTKYHHGLNSYVPNDRSIHVKHVNETKVNVYPNLSPSRNNPRLFQSSHVPVHNKPLTSQKISNPSRRNSFISVQTQPPSKMACLGKNTLGGLPSMFFPRQAIPGSPRMLSMPSTSAQSQSNAFLEPEDSFGTGYSCCAGLPSMLSVPSTSAQSNAFLEPEGSFGTGYPCCAVLCGKNRTKNKFLHPKHTNYDFNGHN